MEHRQSSRNLDSKRAQEHSEMLDAALARPGVREIMAVYDLWQKKDRSLDPYRLAAKQSAWITTTNSSNVGLMQPAEENQIAHLERDT